MKWIKTLSYLSITITGIASVIGYIASQNVLNFKLRDVEVIKRREIKAKRYDEDKFNHLNPINVKILSKNGYMLNTKIVKKYDHDYFMIFCHGVTENHITSVKYMNMFLDLGFNGVIFDHRRHGQSGGLHSTYGYYEKFDLESIISYLKSQYGYDIHFGIHGESMGAVTTLLYAGELANEADFYVADCPFASFENELNHIIKQKSKITSSTFLHLLNLFLKLRTKFSLYEVSPIRVIQNIEQPILFIHSKPDTFIPYTDSVKLYNKKIGKKMKWYPEHGGHASSFNVNPITYKKKVTQFLETFDLLPKEK
ncbi:alpha/beta hydrolase [Macrococcus sp. DPC7161]|uniref:alpha/beta hydrolase n=1 Tax=Macrococcus sp. DPC7161 TaxID=2507060 RepID=UPI00100AEDB5|nr:alpha/beta hydrolase [Macrococcus sp. DPC7161]RXK19311.1 alpha/beta hydrolase [Macrococcus sp. DPC7161]